MRQVVRQSVAYLEHHPYVLLVLAPLFWGSNFVLGRVIVQTVPPFHFSMVRWLLAFMIFLPFAWRELRRHYRLFQQHWLLMFCLSLTGIAGFNTLLYIALQYTTSINATLVNSTAPLLIVLLSVLFLRDRLSAWQYVGVVLSFAGVVWVISGGQLERLVSLEFNMGDLFVLAAVLSWSIYSVLMKKWGADLPKQATFMVTMVIGLLILSPFYVWETLRSPFQWGSLTFDMWLGIVYISIFPTLVAFTCWNEGVIRVGPSRASNYLHLIVVFAGIFAVLIGETYTLVQLIGAIFIIGGVLIVSNYK
ncbi:drug/metabolite transporter (DMT)-like permease [Caldalkalibacillus uzonensis]|uniref:Drug/metabolite transporter (DMT)-like permease n=1 Tax=Caldalkalibacillus uzonensis TaxID=353224 RepID=A0ABU0CNK4_9BACI|nr:DMT family transporter [Caldalkalibacillus uzonensis]MDQ0337990.1 drug/metabolite transporter (DMT)-like permease [Caldalkalibacillus uzonensis]